MDSEVLMPRPPPTPTVPWLPVARATHRPADYQRPLPDHGVTAAKTSKSRSGKFAKVMLTVVLLLFAAVVAIAVFATEPRDPAASTSPPIVRLLLGGDATHRERPVNATMFGEEWPLTVEAGTLVCEAVPAPMEVQSVFFVDAAGAIYAVNGTARGTIATHGWNDFETIWKPDPTSSTGIKVNVGPLITAGLEICDPAPITDAVVASDLAGAAVAAMWAASTPEEQATYCNAWNVAPDAARQAFLDGSEKAADFWPALEQVLRDSC